MEKETDKKTEHEVKAMLSSSKGDIAEYEKAQANYEEIKQLKNVVNGSLLFLGKSLKENKDRLYYKTLGYMTFEAFIASDELSFHRSTVYKMIRVYEGFIENLGIEHKEIKDIDMDKLQMILPVCNKTNAKSWIEKARAMSRSDLREEIQGKQEQIKIESSDYWQEFSNVWEKNQPVSRWGKNPKETIFGQFVANLVKYYTKPSDTVVYIGQQDGTVKDVCEELLRKYEPIPEGVDITQLKNYNGELFISYSDSIKGSYESSASWIETMKSSVKVGGRCAFYVKDREYEEDNFRKFENAIIEDSQNKFTLDDMIIIREKPDNDALNRAQRDTQMNRAFERVLVFKRIK